MLFGQQQNRRDGSYRPFLLRAFWMDLVIGPVKILGTWVYFNSLKCDRPREYVASRLQGPEIAA